MDSTTTELANLLEQLSTLTEKASITATDKSLVDDITKIRTQLTSLVQKTGKYQVCKSFNMLIVL
jgi:hypothetical protein